MATAKTKTTDTKTPDASSETKVETVEAKASENKASETKTTEAMGENLTKQAEIAPTHSVNDETTATVEPVAVSQTATKATDATAGEDKTAKITVKVKNNGATLLETRTGTMIEAHKTTTITVSDDKTKEQVLKNIEQLNYLHGNTLEVK